MGAEKAGKSRAAAAASAIAALAASSAATSAASGARQGVVPKQDQEVEEEEEDDDEAGARQFVWDAAKGMLVDAAGPDANAEGVAAKADDGASAKVPSKDADNDTSADPAKTGGGNDDGDEASEDSDDEDSEEVDDADAESRNAFLNEASTPELIKQAVSIGGAMAQSVSDRWVLDQATQLHFHYGTRSQQMHCWNPNQGYLHLWRGRGRLEFVWAAAASGGGPPPAAGIPLPPGLATGLGSAGAEVSSSEQPSSAATASTPPNADAATDAPATAEAGASSKLTLSGRSLWVTVIPPSVLEVGGADPNAQVDEEMEVPSRALGQIIGAGHAGLKELQFHSGASISVRPRGEQESAAHLQLKGTKSQISAAKNAIEQKLVLAIGAAKVERLQKHQTSEYLAKLSAESGTDAAAGGVAGLLEFAEKWSLKAVIVRKLRKLDAMLQRYLIRHFKPWKAKPANALRSYVTTLLMPPQRWRLQALHEDGELDGEVCETAMVGPGGAVVGSKFSQEAISESGAEQFVELEVDQSIDKREASRVYGDVQPQHCRFLRMGDDFYVWALEAQIGTIVDTKKYRQSDGPIPVRDGSIVAIGKYLLYCEVGDAAMLQDRRKRLLAGENFWKILNASLPAFKAAPRTSTTETQEESGADGMKSGAAIAEALDEEGEEAEGEREDEKAAGGEREDEKAPASVTVPRIANDGSFLAMCLAMQQDASAQTASGSTAAALDAEPPEVHATSRAEGSEGQGKKRKLEDLAVDSEIDFQVHDENVKVARES